MPDCVVQAIRRRTRQPRRCGRCPTRRSQGTISAPSSSAGAVLCLHGHWCLKLGQVFACLPHLLETMASNTAFQLPRFGELGQTVANMLESPLAVSAQSSPVRYIGFDMQPARIRVSPALTALRCWCPTSASALRWCSH